MSKINIAIIEDNKSYMESIKCMVGMNDSMHFVDAFSSAEHFEASLNIGRVNADVILLDLYLPGKDGFTLIPLIQKRLESSKILILTQEDSYMKTLEAIRLGVAGYVLKNSPVEDIERAINDVYAGGCVIDARLCGYVLKAMETDQDEEGGVVSPREHQILKLLALGYTKKEVAIQLNVSYSTVAQGTERIYEKLRVPNVTAAVAAAIRQGLI